MMNHKGYLGAASMDVEAKVFRGRVVNIADTVTFQGRTFDEVHQAFVDSVEDYLEFCASCDKPANPPFSGKLTLRLSPEVHQALRLATNVQCKSLHKLTLQVLGRYVRKHTSSPSGSP